MMIQVASQVQLASLVESCKRRQLLSRQSVGPQVFTLGENFMIGEELWAGLAIVSPDALFLLKMQRINEQPLPRPGRPSDTNLDFCPKPLLAAMYSELPVPLTQDQGWPKPPNLDCEVAILLREETRQVRAIPFTTEVDFESESPRIRVTCSSAGPNLAAQRLQSSGWIRGASSAAATSSFARPRLPKPRTRYVISAVVLALGLATIIAIQMRSMSSQLTLLLCMPILALVAYLGMRFSGYWPERPDKGATQP